MGNELKILYLYNSALLISYGSDSVFIDGVFEDNNIFDKMPPGYKETLLDKAFPFDKVMGLLFTHCHDDHYNESAVGEYASKYGDEGLIVPDKYNEDLLGGDHGSFSMGSFEISYLKTRHIYVVPLTCTNYVYKICAADKSVGVTGDAEPESLMKIIDVFGTDADAFFINAATFLYEMKSPDETLLKKIKNLIVYHLPTEKNDDYGYRKAAASVMNKAHEHLEDIKALFENVQEIDV